MDHTQDLIVEVARCQGRTVGWRLWIQGYGADGSKYFSGDTLLVWRDGSVTPGFRSGGRFSPGLDAPIVYEQIVLPELNFLGEGI